MTTGEMLIYTQKYNDILALPKRKRSLKLANLMTELEVNFKIPMIKSDRFNQGNFYLMVLYRMISDERKF
ncbi:hypothetical protein COJ96_26380 [Bacillus sp. AFS073361]|uniref:hypothetical protein n=1 Tax=Bacillus sp. AFS073361 TaxID=2033511 RepID=UPI000BF7CF19|nr:hypothetical protein [Bacillus sp. AFS073361]PFP17542.1 hypothetical protein COJ96_26380 [Bacillus sp. AFS073361]